MSDNINRKLPIYGAFLGAIITQDEGRSTKGLKKAVGLPTRLSLDEEIGFWERQFQQNTTLIFLTKDYCLMQLINAMARKIKDKYCE